MLQEFLTFIQSQDGIGNKVKLINLAVAKFNLVCDSKVYYCNHFAVRFSSSKSQSFSNTVLSLSNLRKFDNTPFIVCLVTPNKNLLFLANTSFLHKISHSSQKLTIDNIKGSFNGSDIMRIFEGVNNEPKNFEELYAIHENISFEENLVRLVEATNNIVPTGTKFEVSIDNKNIILEATIRSLSFIKSSYFSELEQILNNLVEKHHNEILIASHIENVNLRGRIIEYLITNEDSNLKQQLINALKQKDNIPNIITGNNLGDYEAMLDYFHTKTDIKTKIMLLNSNPKAYNIDKFLEFLAENNSIYLLFFIGITPKNEVKTCLCSVFQKNIIDATIVQTHWAGRNSRGVTQFNGNIIKNLIEYPNNDIDIQKANDLLEKFIAL